MEDERGLVRGGTEDLFEEGLGGRELVVAEVVEVGLLWLHQVDVTPRRGAKKRVGCLGRHCKNQIQVLLVHPFYLY